MRGVSAGIQCMGDCGEGMDLRDVLLDVVPVPTLVSRVGRVAVEVIYRAVHIYHEILRGTGEHDHELR